MYLLHCTVPCFGHFALDFHSFYESYTTNSRLIIFEASYGRFTKHKSWLSVKKRYVWLLRVEYVSTQQDSVWTVFVASCQSRGQTKLGELKTIYILFTSLIIEFSSVEDHESYISKGSEVVIVCLQKLEVLSFYYQHNTTEAQKSRLNQKKLKLKYVFILRYVANVRWQPIQ